MRCRPSEVLLEDERDIDLWILYSNVEAMVAERNRPDA